MPARERDPPRTHQQLGRDLALFHVTDGALGAPTWLPGGLHIYRALEALIIDIYRRHGYRVVRTPLVRSSRVWQTSGHLDRYRGRMIMCGDAAALRPMNCPGHAEVFASSPRSYRELPLRIGELGHVYRNERSGTVNGLLRARSFTIDDAHIFTGARQVRHELEKCLQLARDLYAAFGIPVRAELSLRPAQRLGDDERWDEAEAALRQALDAAGFPFTERAGEGAFYGPKVDLHAPDLAGRAWQLGSVQLDYMLAERFGLTYRDSSDSEQTPVIIHRALLGSIERFIAIVLEHTQGRLPLWLSPEQVRVLPVTAQELIAAASLSKRLENEGLRVRFDTERPLRTRIRRAHAQAVPIIAIVGEQELATCTLTLRRRGHPQEQLAHNRAIEHLAEQARAPRI